MRSPPVELRIRRWSRALSTSKGARLYYEVEGEGHPLLLIHGGLGDLRMWDEQMPAFAERYRVIRYDTRGFGRSETEDVEFTERGDAAAVLQHLEAGSAYVVGQSRGGNIALDLALDEPAAGGCAGERRGRHRWVRAAGERRAASLGRDGAPLEREGLHRAGRARDAGLGRRMGPAAGPNRPRASPEGLRLDPDELRGRANRGKASASLATGSAAARRGPRPAPGSDRPRRRARRESCLGRIGGLCARRTIGGVPERRAHDPARGPGTLQPGRPRVPAPRWIGSGKRQPGSVRHPLTNSYSAPSGLPAAGASIEVGGELDDTVARADRSDGTDGDGGPRHARNVGGHRQHRGGLPSRRRLQRLLRGRLRVQPPEPDDPIVFPRQPGRSHDHTYFGARSTDAFSTPASLREDGRTTCRLRADTAAYWAPTLLVDGRAVEPLAVVAFYVRRTGPRSTHSRPG